MIDYKRFHNLTIDLGNDKKRIIALELHKIDNIYAIKKKFKPSESLVETLQNYLDSFKFDKVIDVEDGKNVF